MEANRLHILVVANDNEIVAPIQTAVRGQNHHLSYVSDGRNVFDVIASQHFDLVILDSDLHKIDAITVTKGIKAFAEQKNQWLPVILVCDKRSEEFAVPSMFASVDQCINKPIQVETLTAKIDAFVQSIKTYQKLLADKAREQVISDGILDAVISIDKAGTILTVNKAAELMFGYTHQELIGRNVDILMPEPYHSEHNAYIKSYLDTGIKKVIGTPGREVQGLRKNGELFHLRLGVSEIIVDNEPVFISILSDISNIKKAEDELRKNAHEMRLLHDAIQNDLDMANVVMEQLIDKEALDNDEQISYFTKPAVKFSGDLVLSQRGPCGKLYVMVADATGHGLSAAISALPALWVFYGMVKKSATVSEIAAEINFRLKQSIPVGRFVAAHIASINNPAQTVRLWSGGMPPAWLIDDKDGSVSELPSTHPALGILEDRQFDPSCHIVEWDSVKQMLLLSDGVYEARTEDGISLGEDKILRIIHDKPGNSLLSQLTTLLDEHLQDKPAVDDISIACIHLRR